VKNEAVDSVKGAEVHGPQPSGGQDEISLTKGRLCV
jgi:hypothetical protein